MGEVCIYILGIILLLVIALWLRARTYDGKIIITQDADGKKLFSLELDKAPVEIENMKRITFKVVPSDDFVI
jgi:hypothetical protein